MPMSPSQKVKEAWSSGPVPVKPAGNAFSLFSGWGFKLINQMSLCANSVSWPRLSGKRWQDFVILPIDRVNF